MAAIRSILFIALRVFELFILIPIIGMLAFFVHGFQQAQQLTPDYILVLFVTSCLAAGWVLLTLGRVTRHRNGFVVGLIDMGFMGAFIAGVYKLRSISDASCARFTQEIFYFELGIFGVDSPGINVNKTCAMLKACFAFGIIEIILFFFSGLVCWASIRASRDDEKNTKRVVVRSERHRHVRSDGRHHRRSHDGRGPSRHSSHRSQQYQQKY